MSPSFTTGFKLFCLVLLGLAPACSGSRQHPRPIPVNTVSKKELRALAKSLSARKTFRARYNPSYCKCPHTEVWSGKRWLRVVLKADEPETQVLKVYLKRAETDRRGELHREYQLTGTLETDVVAINSRLYLTFSVKSFRIRTGR